MLAVLSLSGWLWGILGIWVVLWTLVALATLVPPAIVAIKGEPNLAIFFLLAQVLCGWTIGAFTFGIPWFVIWIAQLVWAVNHQPWHAKANAKAYVLTPKEDPREAVLQRIRQRR